MMKRTLVFDDQMTGHHIEYLHHLYNAAISRIDEEFIFAVPRIFDEYSIHFNWATSSNVSIYYLDEYDSIKASGNLLKRSLYLSLLLRKTIKKFDITHVFLIVLMGFLPFLPFILSKKIRVSGIIYQVYLYRWKDSKFLTRIQDVFKYCLITKFKIFSKVFLLNDECSPIFLNKKYRTNKFAFLADPVFQTDNLELYDLRKELGISPSKKIILHFGAMNKNKGTIDILESIILMSNEQLNGYTFIFAGQIQDEIKESFYSLYNTIKDKADIALFDMFCSFNFVGSLCLTSDMILCPYKRTSQSSGVIGYSAVFNKPVIVPKTGLLGKLVKRNKLGYLLDSTHPFEIINAIRKPSLKRINKRYLKTNSISNFVNTILSN